MRVRVPLFAGVLALVAPANAAADDKPTDAEITSDTSAQFYEMRSPTGETVIARRRVTTTLGVAAYDLLDKPEAPGGPTLMFRARMRYDADYGGSTEETNVSSYNRLVPGFQRGPIDLMYGYVEGRRFLKGWLGFKLGRQYVTDALGWWSFDGGQVKLTTPYYFAAELYGGLEQRGGMPLSTPRYERDGVWRGDRTGYDGPMWPSFQPNDVAPAYGAALESAGFTWLHGRLTYRRVYNTGESNVAEFANGLRGNAPYTYDGSRISSERIGYAMDGTLPTLGGVKAGFAYDLYVARMANVFASVDWFVTKRVVASLDYEFYQPTFDADSIWNFFQSMPMNDLGARVAWDPSDRLGLSAGLHGRVYRVQKGTQDVAGTSPNGLADANYYPSSSLDPMGGANMAARYHIGEGSVGARGAADFAGNGDRLGIDVFGDRTLETRYILQGRAGVWQWNDQLRPDRDATSFQYVLGAGYKLFPRSTVLGEWEHDMNRISGQRFRVMLFLTLALASR